MLKKKSLGQNKRYKKCRLFSFASWNSSNLLLLIRNTYMMKHNRTRLSKCVCGIFHFRLRFTSITAYIFV